MVAPGMRRLVVAMLLTVGCGGASVAEAPPGRSHAPRDAEAIELELRTTDGTTVEIADQRGSPMLVALFATYDGASVASQRALSRFTRDHLDTVVIAIALQPNAEVFAAEYARMIQPPYTVAYDPSERIGQGTSALGPIDAIPAFYAIDARGRIRGVHHGVVSERELEILFERAQ